MCDSQATTIGAATSSADEGNPIEKAAPMKSESQAKASKKHINPDEVVVREGRFVHVGAEGRERPVSFQFTDRWGKPHYWTPSGSSGSEEMAPPLGPKKPRLTPVLQPKLGSLHCGSRAGVPANALASKAEQTDAIVELHSALATARCICPSLQRLSEACPIHGMDSDRV